MSRAPSSSRFSARRVRTAVRAPRAATRVSPVRVMSIAPEAPASAWASMTTSSCATARGHAALRARSTRRARLRRAPKQRDPRARARGFSRLIGRYSALLPARRSHLAAPRSLCVSCAIAAVVSLIGSLKECAMIRSYVVLSVGLSLCLMLAVGCSDDASDATAGTGGTAGSGGMAGTGGSAGSGGGGEGGTGGGVEPVRGALLGLRQQLADRRTVDFVRRAFDCRGSRRRPRNSTPSFPERRPSPNPSSTRPSLW